MGPENLDCGGQSYEGLDLGLNRGNGLADPRALPYGGHVVVLPDRQTGRTRGREQFCSAQRRRKLERRQRTGQGRFSARCRTCSTQFTDARFRPAGVDGGTSVGESWTYDLADRRTGAALGNGIASLFQYDANGRLTRLKHELSGNPLHDVVLGYDAVGNRLFKKDQVNTSRSELYQYDKRHRLRQFQRGTLGPNNDTITEAAHPVLSSRRSWLPTAALDSRGNWLEVTTILNGLGTTEARTPNGVNEYTSIDPDTSADPPYPVSPGHDPNGNLTNDPTAPNVGSYADGQEYEYDPENRLTRVTRSVDSQPLLDIRYDALGRRAESVEHIDPTDGSTRTAPLVTRHVYAGLTVVEEYDVTDYGGGPGSDRLREFVWGDWFPEPVAMIDWSGAGDEAAGQNEVLHYLRDELGSVVGLTNESDAMDRAVHEKTVTIRLALRKRCPTARS